MMHENVPPVLNQVAIKPQFSYDITLVGLGANASTFSNFRRCVYLGESVDNSIIDTTLYTEWSAE